MILTDQFDLEHYSQGYLLLRLDQIVSRTIFLKLIPGTGK